MSEKLLRALGRADANMYLCSKDIRPREKFSFLLIRFSWRRNSDFCLLRITLNPIPLVVGEFELLMFCIIQGVAKKSQ